LILIKIENCFYCVYRDIIEYRDNFLDNNREMIFLISPSPINEWLNCCYILSFSLVSFISRTTKNYICSVALIFFVRHKMSCVGHQSVGPLEIYFQAWFVWLRLKQNEFWGGPETYLYPRTSVFVTVFCAKKQTFLIFLLEL
jgi:hypothetical protein